MTMERCDKVTRRANQFWFPETVKPRIEKYFCFTEYQISLYVSHPVLLRRASAVVTDVGRVAVDA
ncbi:hypothetical protein ACO2JO_18755, partial [Leptospira interrogans]